MDTKKWYAYLWPDLLGVTIGSPFVYAMNGFWLGTACLAVVVILLIIVHAIVWKWN